MEYYETLIKVSNTLSADKAFIIDSNLVAKSKSQVALPPYAHPVYRSFYEQVEKVEIAWTHRQFENMPYVSGKVKILPAQTVFSDWEGIVWFKNIPDKSNLKQFKVLDFFADEACVGFYDMDGKTEELHYLYFGEKPIPLKINLDGYCQLLSLSQGYFYWQLAIIEILKKKKSQESRDFKSYMPQLFKAFDYDSFKNLLLANRISE